MGTVTDGELLEVLHSEPKTAPLVIPSVISMIRPASNPPNLSSALGPETHFPISVNLPEHRLVAFPRLCDGC